MGQRAFAGGPAGRVCSLSGSDPGPHSAAATKSEFRNPKAERIPKAEIRIIPSVRFLPKRPFGIRFSEFLRLSAFGFRIFLWLALFLSPLIAPAATLTARLSGNNFYLGESITLELVFEGGTPTSAPQISVPGLAIRFGGTKQFMQTVNGRTVNEFILTYQVTPQKPGTYTIPPVVSMVGNQRVASAPVQFTVNQVDTAVANQSAFIILTVPKTNLYVGELAIIQAELYAIAEQNGLPELKAEGFTPGKWLGQGSQVVNFSGRNYARYSFVSYVIPNQPGRFELGPARFGVRLPAPNARRTFFGDILDWVNTEVASKAVPVTVWPLPATNVPPSFLGAVGSFNVVVTASPTNVAVGDPVTVKVEISGNSLLDSLILPPQPAWKEFRVYPPTSKLENANALGLGGRKIFEQVVVPQSTEVRQVPPFQFTFFDTAAGVYRTLTGPVFPLIVRPSASGMPIGPVEETNQVDIVHIKPELGAVTLAQAPLLARPGFLALQLLPVAVWLALLARRKHLDRLANNPRLRRRREADKAIAAGLSELPKLAAPPTAQEFFAAVFRLLQERLGERLNLPASAITESVIDERLRPAGVEEDVLKDLGELFQICNQARYAPKATPKEFAETTAQLKRVLDALAAVKLDSPSAKVGMLVAGLLFGSLWSASAGGPAADFEAANKLYEQGQYTAAIAAYNQLLQGGRVSPALYFNLGNAYFKAGQTGRAIAAYRLAEQLAPRDPDIRANLQFARRAVTGKDDAGPKGWERWLNRLSLNEWTVLAAGAGWVWLALLAAGQWRAEWRRALRQAGWAALAVFLLLGLGLGIEAYQQLGKTTAIVVARDVQARLGPYDESKAAVALPDGSELEIVSAKDDWFEIRDHAQRAGWVKKEQVILFGSSTFSVGQDRKIRSPNSERTSNS